MNSVQTKISIPSVVMRYYEQNTSYIRTNNNFLQDKEANPCAGRWHNMDNVKTRKAWAVYDETGIMLAVCRHGMSLLLGDMIQSGEQCVRLLPHSNIPTDNFVRAKYPLAIVSKLINAFGADLGGGYDIGCSFETTLRNSSVGPSARLSNHTCLVGAFHGHAHRRVCQLDHLATYVKGLGLEDLETCERTFSKSNALAATTRYASIFHRQQAISSYFSHADDYEVYANLSKLFTTVLLINVS